MYQLALRRRLCRPSLTIAAPWQHASDTMAEHIRQLVAQSWLADGASMAQTGVMQQPSPVPSWHHGGTQWAPTWLRDSTHDSICDTNCIDSTTVEPIRYAGNTLATPSWRLRRPLTGRNSARRAPVPSAKNPFFVLWHAAQRMGPLGHILEEIRHGGILGTKPPTPASKPTPPFAAACRVAATGGLGAWSDGVFLVSAICHSGFDLVGAG